jgi:hypothetical protein
MGCGSSRTKLDILQTPLNFHMDTTGVESVDTTFSNASGIIEKLENMRVALIDNRDILIVKTGASAYQHPDTHACLLSYFWLVSTYTNGSLKNLKINMTDSAPFFEIQGLEGKKVTKAHETLVNYIKGVWEIKDQVESISEEMNTLSETIANESSSYMDQVKEACKDDFKKM